MPDIAPPVLKHSHHAVNPIDHIALPQKGKCRPAFQRLAHGTGGPPLVLHQVYLYNPTTRDGEFIPIVDEAGREVAVPVRAVDGPAASEE